jgi:hypothetical protein
MRREMGERAQDWALTNFNREKFGRDLLQILEEAV